MDVHYQLVPYLLTTGSEAFQNNKSSITPLAKHNNFIEKVIYLLNINTIPAMHILGAVEIHGMIQGSSCMVSELVLLIDTAMMFSCVADR